MTRGLGVNAHGDVAEVWQDGEKVGSIFNWHVTGWNDEWSGTADKQTFRPSFSGGAVEFVFLLTPQSGDVFHLKAIGEVSGFTAGVKSRQEVGMKGTRLWTVTTEIPSASS